MCTDQVNTTEFANIVAKRLAKDDELFFVNTSSVCLKYGKTIIQKKRLKGIQENDEIIIHPIFEDVEILSDDITIIKLIDKLALYSLRDRRLLSDFEYTSIRLSNDILVLSKPNGRIALFNLKNSKFLHESGDYDEFNLKDFSTEYIWARRSRFFDYIHRDSGKVISIPGIIMAYDVDWGIFGKDEYNNVALFNEYGVVDTQGLRQVVKDHGGYLTLRNFTYNIEHIIDIYGNILNI